MIAWKTKGDGRHRRYESAYYPDREYAETKAREQTALLEIPYRVIKVAVEQIPYQKARFKKRLYRRTVRDSGRGQYRATILGIDRVVQWSKESKEWYCVG